jgi:peptidoglycan/LPS O-acetylase OafA/YrhL
MQRLTRLDGLRGVLAVYVMLGHALPFTDLPAVLATPFRHGEAAVDLFFAISGLVIVNSLERFNGAFWPFMAARAKRLLPVYFLVLAASVLLLAGDPLPAMPWVGGEGHDILEAVAPAGLGWHIAAHALLLHGLIPQTVLPYAYVTLLGPAWSLSTEWQFYVVIALAARGRFAALALGLLALGAAYRLGPTSGWGFSRAFLPDAAPFFALGLASAVWLRGGGRWVFVICLLGACGLGALQGPEKALVPLAWGLAMLAQSQRWGAVLEHRVMQYFGAISYPLYLVNEPVLRGLAMWMAPLAHGDVLWFSVLWLPAVLGVSLGLAAALHHGLELRLMRQRKDFLLPVIAGPLGG